MNRVNVQNKQTLIDVAVQLLGSVEGLMVLMKANGIESVTTLPDAGTEIQYEDTDVVDKKAIIRFATMQPATAPNIVASDMVEYHEDDYDGDEYF